MHDESLTQFETEENVLVWKGWQDTMMQAHGLDICEELSCQEQMTWLQARAVSESQAQPHPQPLASNKKPQKIINAVAALTLIQRKVKLIRLPQGCVQAGT